MPLLGHAAPRVTLDTYRDIPDSIHVAGMPTGATIHQLSSIEDMLADMHSAGLDHRVVAPPPFTFRYWAEPSYGEELTALLNDATAAAVAQAPDRLTGLATLPLQDPDLAIREFDRATGALGLRGVEVSASVGDLNLSDPRFEAVFAHIARSGLPVLVHPDFVPYKRWMDYYLINVIGMTVETGAAIANIIFSGMLERLPDLRFCFVHGGGVAPYLFGRWQKSWDVRDEPHRDLAGDWRDSLGMMFFDSLTHSTKALEFLVNLVGAERVPLGTDYPFDVRNPEPVTVLEELALTEEQRRSVTVGAAHEWMYGKADR
jgi:aminocarboxymuconate-semialdehyde decarboxylase